jgi:hypothetical protein
MNKGILKNTKAGWFVLYQVRRDEITSGYDSIPLHPDSQTWMDGYHLYEGKEVEFEVRVYPSGSRFAKTIGEDDLRCSYPDCICQGDEITYCNNRTPEQVVLGDKTALVEDVFHQGMKKTAIQELIDEIVEHLTYDDKLSEDSRATYETIRLRCLGKLLVEKEQLISAHNQGYADGYRDNGNSPIDYYNQIYGK